MAKAKQPKDLINGTKIDTAMNGLLTIIHYERNDRITVRFQDTGYERTTSAAAIRNGVVKDNMRPSLYGVGYIGDGLFKAKVNGKTTREYATWSEMIKRCYSESYHQKKPTYIECEVCEDWQDFQNFAAWMNENHTGGMDGMCLDKDIKLDGNKIYSPETCMIVSISDNSRKATEYKMKKHKVKSPSGEVYDVLNQTEFCLIHEINRRQFNDMVNGNQKTCHGWSLA